MTSPHEDLWLAKAERFAASGEGKFLREWAGVSLGELVAATGVSGVTLYRWECGQEAPRGVAGADWARIVYSLQLRHSQAAVWH